MSFEFVKVVTLVIQAYTSQTSTSAIPIIQQNFIGSDRHGAHERLEAAYIDDAPMYNDYLFRKEF